MSAASAKTQDPSMEEILASIRRIIADDGEGSREGGAGSASTAKEPTAPSAATPADDDDVLDLTAFATSPPPRADLDIDLPDLAFRNVQPEEAEPTGEPVASKPAPEVHAPRPAVQLGTPAPDRVAAPPREELLSTHTMASVGHAFNLLSHTVLSQNHRTLEDLVQEMLKPMLRDWLDDNLPPLVERLVRTEIERVARGTR